LAEQLIKSLENEEYPPQEEGDRRWLETVNRRVAEINEGKTVLVPGEEVMQRLREKYVG
jgi:hypothetical protein